MRRRGRALVRVGPALVVHRHASRLRVAGAADGLLRRRRIGRQQRADFAGAERRRERFHSSHQAAQPDHRAPSRSVTAARSRSAPGPALAARAAAGSKSSGGAGSGIVAGSCTGSRTARESATRAITVANSSDVTGPIAGLFTSAQQAVKAYLAYFNSTTKICGRKINLINLDSQTSDTGNQQQETTACSEAFALVGSMSAFDAGGAETGAHCGNPRPPGHRGETPHAPTPPCRSAPTAWPSRRCQRHRMRISRTLKAMPTSTRR